MMEIMVVLGGFGLIAFWLWIIVRWRVGLSAFSCFCRTRASFRSSSIR